MAAEDKTLTTIQETKGYRKHLQSSKYLLFTLDNQNNFLPNRLYIQGMAQDKAWRKIILHAFGSYI